MNSLELVGSYINSILGRRYVVLTTKDFLTIHDTTSCILRISEYESGFLLTHISGDLCGSYTKLFKRPLQDIFYEQDLIKLAHDMLRLLDG